MEDVERLLKGTVEELERLLSAKNVLGDPIEREGATIIPIVSYGFAFGAGGGSGGKSGAASGTGGGTADTWTTDNPGGRTASSPISDPVYSTV